jgi:hypothetical protein
MTEWFALGVSGVALIVSVVIARAQFQLGLAQRDIAAQQVRLAEKVAHRQEDLAIAHSGAQTAMAWRNQVILLHDRGLDPEEIRWIMCCEDGGTGHEEYNGIIDEVVGNIPRVPPEALTSISTRNEKRRLPRPRGSMRADLDQGYNFQKGHPAGQGT